ncbi:MAG: hypothetical protein IJR51_04625 [Clostridia bacterium]|nr:hypothetical protein [Clostridia bacterium]
METTIKSKTVSYGLVEVRDAGTKSPRYRDEKPAVPPVRCGQAEGSQRQPEHDPELFRQDLLS